MWYSTKVIVKQNPNYYCQIDTAGNNFAYKKGENSPNKIDKTEYEYCGLLGAMFKSLETKEPTCTDIRYIFDVPFTCTRVYKRGFRKYECCWTNCEYKSYDSIREFTKKHIFR